MGKKGVIREDGGLGILVGILGKKRGGGKRREEKRWRPREDM